jgi:hypothetical protein
MSDEDDILDLPIEQPYRDVCIEYLTRALISVEQGEIQSICFVAEETNGSFHFWATPTDNVQGMGAQLIHAGVRRLGFAFRSEVEKR